MALGLHNRENDRDRNRDELNRESRAERFRGGRTEDRRREPEGRKRDFDDRKRDFDDRKREREERTRDLEEGEEDEAPVPKRRMLSTVRARPLLGGRI